MATAATVAEAARHPRETGRQKPDRVTKKNRIPGRRNEVRKSGMRSAGIPTGYDFTKQLLMGIGLIRDTLLSKTI